MVLPRGASAEAPGIQTSLFATLRQQGGNLGGIGGHGNAFAHVRQYKCVCYHGIKLRYQGVVVVIHVHKDNRAAQQVELRNGNNFAYLV